MMSHRILPAALLLCALAAACGENPAGSDTHAQPAGPAYDGGYTIGSGGAAAQGGYTTTEPGNTEDSGGFGMGGGWTEPEDTGTAPADGEQRGYTIGSGG